MVALIGNPVSNKGWGAVVGEQVFTMLAEAGQRHGFDVMDLTGTSFDDSLTAARENRALYDYLVVVGGDGMIALCQRRLRQRHPARHCGGRFGQ